MTDASAAMHKRDHVAKELGIEITHAEVGLAVVSMTVEERMTNGLGVCHGGLLFTLADTAMAHASNAGNERTLSTTASIEWISTARIGDHLVATSRARRTREEDMAASVRRRTRSSVCQARKSDSRRKSTSSLFEQVCSEALHSRTSTPLRSTSRWRCQSRP